MTSINYRQRGIALMQALFLTAILLTVVLSVAYQSREQVHTAFAVQHRTEAFLANYSSNNDLIFALLTENWQGRSEDPQSITHRWNFYGQPFEFSASEVRIQDALGLANTGAMKPELLASVAGYFGYSAEMGSRLAEQLADWQDADDIARPFGAEQGAYGDRVWVRNGPVQDLSELGFLPAMNPEFQRHLSQISTLYLSSTVNILNAPEALLPYYFGEDLAEIIKQQRSEGNVDQSFISRTSGISGDEFYTYTTGPVFRISISSAIESARYSDEKTVVLNPYTNNPVTIWDQRKTFDDLRFSSQQP